jgi:hypothetical protein
VRRRPISRINGRGFADVMAAHADQTMELSKSRLLARDVDPRLPLKYNLMRVREELMPVYLVLHQVLEVSRRKSKMKMSVSPHAVS